MDKILHDPKDPKLWELWYIPYYESRILSINSIFGIPFYSYSILGPKPYSKLAAKGSGFVF